MLNLKMIIGSTRPGRAADRVIPWITGVATGHGAFDVEILDLRDWPLPIFGESFATIGDPRNPTFSAPEVSVAYSGGIGGGIRAVEHMAHIAIEAELVPLRNNVVIPFVGAAFGPDGHPVDDRASAVAKIMLDDLAWWGSVLQRARREGALPPAIMRQMAVEGARR